MYIDDCLIKGKNSLYRRVLLRESIRIGGHVKKRTIANISHLPETQIQALKFVLQNPDCLSKVENCQNLDITSAKSVGAVVLLRHVAKELGITKSLGKSWNASLFMWLIFARLINQGSRLSAVRLARNHAVCEIMETGSFDENDLYNAMDWGYSRQQKIESKLFALHNKRKASSTDHVFLYDVTSTYLEGEKNELAAYGYNRDKKRGKQQVVYGLLTDADGVPISVEAFNGNTKDNATFNSQINKLKKRFGVKSLTLVGDKGMIKSLQIEALTSENFNYITSITRPQIKELLQRQIIQMELFDEKLCEVFDEADGIRYILRRNPRRTIEMEKIRNSKRTNATKKVEVAIKYLAGGQQRKVATQVKKITEYLKKIKIDGYTVVTGDEQTRQIRLVVDNEKLEEIKKLDGCYVIKTDLEKSRNLKKEVIHDRYKALAEVEWAFRTNKTGYLEVRPVYVRKEKRTRAHLLITMIAYKMEQFLRNAWKNFDITVKEAINCISGIKSIVIDTGFEKIQRVPRPDDFTRDLLNAVGVELPKVLSVVSDVVDTKKKLKNRR